MGRVERWSRSARESVTLAWQALRLWRGRQILVAVAAALVFAVAVGLATVLIPNPVFGRDIAPVAWNYPVWLLASVLAGLLVATYIRPPGTAPVDEASVDARRGIRLGSVGGLLAWFAVGCPVCNKVALLALGYSGALTWFAPVQPVLAVIAIVLSAVALIYRLRGQVSCTLPTPVTA